MKNLLFLLLFSFSSSYSQLSQFNFHTPDTASSEISIDTVHHDYGLIAYSANDATNDLADTVSLGGTIKGFQVIGMYSDSSDKNTYWSPSPNHFNPNTPIWYEVILTDLKKEDWVTIIIDGKVIYSRTP